MEESVDDELKALRLKRIHELIGEDSIIDSGPTETRRPQFPDTPVPVTDATIQEFIARYPVTVVDCWAPWCGPCCSMAPVLDALAKSYQGKIVFGKLNVDENPRTAQMYQTMSIPTLLIFKNGKPVDRIVGALPKQMIEQKLRVHL